MWDRAARVAGGLRAAGLERGDRAAILLPNGVDWVLAFWGAQLAGVVAVPVNTRFKEPEIDYVVSDCGAGHVFKPGQALPVADPLIVDDQVPGDVAAIFYTSGTTGFPKGAMTSHANFLANTENAFRCVGINKAEVAFTGHADQRSAVSRHRVQQPVARAQRARRPRVHPS